MKPRLEPIRNYQTVSQPLWLDLDYLYEAGERDDLYATVDYGRVVECMAELLEKGEFRLLETGRGW